MTARHVLAFDTETALIRPALLAPPLVCVTWARPDQPPRIVTASNAKPIIRAWLEDPACLIVGHNVAYDLAVVGAEYPDLLPAIFAAYDADRVTDTQIREQLIDTARGVYGGSVTKKGRFAKRKYDLESLAQRCAGFTIQKDAWRLSYAEFIGVPLERWPERAREVQAQARIRLATLPDDEEHAKERDGLRLMIEGDPERCTTYPLEDAAATLAVYQAQETHAAFLKDQFRQARAAFALHLSSAWGICTDADGVRRMREVVEAERAKLDADLRALGLIREDGTRDTKVAKRRMIAMNAEDGIPVIRTAAHFAESLTLAERTAKGLKPRCIALDGTPLDDGHDDCAEHVCLDADACERSEDEILIAYAERTTLGKQLSNDIPALEKGTIYPVHTRYGFAATGRTTSSKPNIQNQSKRAGYRECFIPRPGRVFVQCDYPTLELYTLAEVCTERLGQSKLAEALNASPDSDPHLWMAAQMLGITYAEAQANKERPDVQQARQLAKPANFGFPGGMGVTKFLTATRKSMGRENFAKLGLNDARAKQLKEEWFRAWPEMFAYFQRAGDACDSEDGTGRVESLYTGRVRGGAFYCAVCNTPFQGLGADCAKNAAWLIARAQYVEPASPLFNTRTVAFVHDEFIIEAPEAQAHDAAQELARLMLVGANQLLRHVPIPREKLKPLVMRRWSKQAKPVMGADGRLVPGSEAA